MVSLFHPIRMLTCINLFAICLTAFSDNDRQHIPAFYNTRNYNEGASNDETGPSIKGQRAYLPAYKSEEPVQPENAQSPYIIPAKHLGFRNLNDSAIGHPPQQFIRSIL